MHGLAKCKSGQRKVDVTHTQGEKADHIAKHSRQRTTGQYGQDEWRVPVAVHEASRINPDAVKRSVRQGKLPCLANHDMHAQRQHHENHQQIDDVQHIARDREGQHTQQQQCCAKCHMVQ